MAAVSKELLKKIRHIEVQTSHLANDVLAGAWHSAFKGKGMEFEEVREFVEGDDTRDIDWNVTARMHQPHVKRFREERELTVMLVVDVSGSAYFGSGNTLKAERIAEIAAILAFSAIKNNDKVGLLLFSDHVEKYIPPKKGTRHVLRVIRELLAFKPQGKGTDVSSALTHLGHVQTKSSICFLITDLLCVPKTSELAVIAKKHDLISIAVSDPNELLFPSMGMVTVTDLESGESRLIHSANQEQFEKTMEERLDRHKKLMVKVGAGFIDIRTDEPYLPQLKKFFKLRRIRH